MRPGVLVGSDDFIFTSLKRTFGRLDVLLKTMFENQK